MGQGPGPSCAQLPSLALPLAIRMEGNTVDRSKVTLDSSKLLFKCQMEEPGGKRVVRRGSLFTLHLLPKHSRGITPNTNYKVGKRGQGEVNVNNIKLGED